MSMCLKKLKELVLNYLNVLKGNKGKFILNCYKQKLNP